jgi:membrane fusion protein (multidrug efflux system)
LVLEDGTAYATKGRLEFSEVTVGRQTGSVTLRALFPNPDRVLLPGMFVHARIAEGTAGQALLAPQQAVSRNNRGEPTVWVVTAEHRAELRIIRTDRAVGNEWLVKEGLRAGDQIVVEGWQKLTTGSAVKAVEVNLSPAAETSSAPAAQSPSAGQ